ncbi:MAG: helix-turn-helix domain-containing protein, partial [Cryobacterium sp.]|nr:helix-turn-helix domain-containing protein [Cryobacterium sp.]
MSHANALLSPKGRLRLARRVVVHGWNLRRAAKSMSCSPATATKWADRYRAAGEAGMRDLSSRPLTSPNRTSKRTERRIVALRFTRRWGPHRIAVHLHVNRSTV